MYCRFLKVMPAPDAQLTSEGKGLVFSRTADQHPDHGRLDDEMGSLEESMGKPVRIHSKPGKHA